MHVNNKNRNDSIQSNNSQTTANQKIGSSDDSRPKKPSLHQKEKKHLSSEQAIGQAPSEPLSHDAGKQAMNRFNKINSHFQFKDDFTDAEITTSTKGKSLKNEKPSTLEIATKAALENDQNQQFQKHLGIRSPAAEKLINQLKTEQENSMYYDFDQIEENIIKKNKIQETFHCDTPQSLGKISAQELSNAVFGKKCFPQFSDKPEGAQFVAELMEVVNQKMVQMKPTDKGMALVFRFPGTYGAVGHVALGSLWRDSRGQLQLDISHQESLTPQPEIKRNAYTGKIFDTFDTHESYPGQIAPVIESMKLFGLPSVNVFPVPHPEVLRPYTQAFMNIGHFTPYGASRQWKPAKGSGAELAIRPETCFNVFYKTWNKLNGTHVNWEPTLPNVFLKIKPLLGIPADAFTKFFDKNKKEQTLEEACKDEDNTVGIFMQIGTNWVSSGPADINGKIPLKVSRATIKNGGTGIPLNDDVSSFKFTNETGALKGLSLDGKPVIKDKVYTADEASRMKYAGNKDSMTMSYVAPLNGAKTGRAKL
jgi:hypothetical protein